MNSRSLRIRVGDGLFIVCAVVPLFGGCSPNQSVRRGASVRPRTEPVEIDPEQVAERDDVFQIISFWQQVPWLQREGRIVGFKVTTYLRSGETDRGAFVPGTILAWLYEVAHTNAGEREKRLLYMWELDRKAAMGYRVRRRVAMGYPYQFFLTWPREVSVEGKLVEIVFGYDGLDGRMIESSAKQFRVPISTRYRPPATQRGPG